MKRTMTILWLLAAASVSPLIFPIAASGRSTMDELAKLALLPAAGILLVVVALLYRIDDSLAKISQAGLAAGAIATMPWRASGYQVSCSASCRATCLG